MKIKCPGCAAVLNIPETAAGKIVKCPCGKQLRAPGGPAGGAKPAAPSRPAAKPAAPTRPAAPTKPAARPAAPSQPAAGGFDPAMFDELTTQDLKPVRTASRPAAAAAPAAGGKLMQQYAPTGGAGGGGSAPFRRGPIASPWVRLGAAILDGFIIGLMALPVVFAGTFLLGMTLVDTTAIQNAATQAEQEALAAQAAATVMTAYILSVIVGYAIPITVYAIMVTKSGQTPGKKVCGVRIVTSDTQQLPGFVKGVLMRSWVINLIYMVPFVGALVMLVDYLMIFGEKRQCLHDQIAGTIVIES